MSQSSQQNPTINSIQTQNIRSKELINEIKNQIEKLITLYDHPSTPIQIQPLDEDSEQIIRRSISRLEKLNSWINNISVESQLQYIYEKRQKVTENIFKCYTPLTGKHHTQKHLNKQKKPKNRTLDHEFKEKLAGFITKQGCPIWDDEKIDDFIRSIMN
jgi:hypothetical protein